MKRGGFVEAVTYAVNRNSDVWECPYYHGCERFEWDSRKLPVYMQTRNSALGPSWSEWRRQVCRLRGELPYIYGGERWYSPMPMPMPGAAS